MRQSGKKFPWYDSRWLETYVECQSFILEFCPENLAAFERMLAPLKTDPEFQVKRVHKPLDDQSLRTAKAVITGLNDTQLEQHELIRFGRQVVHGHPFFNQLQYELTGLMSDLTGEPLVPSYNFLSLYNNLAICEPHMDDPFAKWTLDICLEQNCRWPIYISQVKTWPVSTGYAGDNWRQMIIGDPENRFSAYDMQEGEGIVFSGSSQWHYRDRITTRQSEKKSTLIFFHFYPAGCDDIINPECWPEKLGLPELGGIINQSA